MTDTATDPKVATLVTSLDAQVNHVIHTLRGAGVDLQHGLNVPGEHNWHLGPDGLLFGDTRTAYTAEQYADGLVDPINQIIRFIGSLSRMTRDSYVNGLLC